MPDLHSLLADEAARMAPADTPPFAAVQRRARRHSRNRTAGGVAVAALVLGVTTSLVVSAVLGTSREVAAPRTPGPTTDFAAPELTLRHPVSWEPYDYDVVNPGLGSRPIVNLSSANVPEPCVSTVDATGTISTCPAVALGPAGVLVTWYQRGRMNPSFDPLDAIGRRETYDGRDALVWEGPSDTDCRTTGASREMRVTIVTKAAPSATWLAMIACLAAPYDVSEQQVLDMLDSVQITD